MSTPLYQALDTTKAEIRLIGILPVGFSLITVPLDSAPDYAALSYVWGDPKNQETIFLQGRNVQIGRNLASFLARIRQGQPGYSVSNQSHSLRDRLHGCLQIAKSFILAAIRFMFYRQSHFEDQTEEVAQGIKYLWADAICINQQDIKERSQQVQLMGRIYDSAHTVYSWIGPRDHSLAFESIRRVASLAQPRNEYPGDQRLMLQPRSLWRYPSLWRETDKSDKSQFRNKAWNAIEDLLSDQYWSRVWIFQEVVLARKMYLMSSGSSTLNWDDLQVAGHTLAGLANRIEQGQEGKPWFLSSWVWLLLEACPHWHNIVMIKAGKETTKCYDEMDKARAIMAKVPRFMKAEYEERVEDLRHYVDQARWYLSFQSSKFTATDPRDQIYGALAITRLPIEPNYERDVSSVYVDFVSRWIKAHCDFRHDRLQSLRPDGSSHPPLALLSFAGTRLFIPPPNTPSWAPDFVAGRPDDRYLFGMFGRDYDEAFRGDRSKDPYVVPDTQSLFVWGFQLEAISTATSSTDHPELYYDLERFGLFASSFISRYPHYVSGIPSSQAIARLLALQDGHDITRQMVVSYSTLSRFMASDYTAKRLQSSSSTRPPGADPMAVFRNWGLDSFNITFPGTSVEQLGLEHDTLFSEKPQASFFSLDDNDWYSMIGGLDQSTHFETSNGYIGMGSADMAEGDYLCVFQGCGAPAVVRKTADGHYQFRGTVFVVGLDPKRFIEANGTQPQWFELR